MFQLNNFAFVSIFFALICGSVLIYVGFINIRSGKQALLQARVAGQPAVWHKQTLLLFGLNNIVFALLIILVVLLSIVVNPTAKYALVVLIVVTLLISIVLVIRCISAALQSVKNLHKR
jgi:threonine/homoserine/homoserine lactone efflux protein